MKIFQSQGKTPPSIPLSSVATAVLLPFRAPLLLIQNTIHNLYLITIDDTPTFVVPNSVFGISAALTKSLLVTTGDDAPNLASLSWNDFAYVAMRTILFNWTNLLIFDLANQRDSGKEDALNKPWRPIPSGRMSSKQMRRCLLAAIPLVLLYNHLILGVGTETCMLIILTWIYNDLGGGDDDWILRNAVIACAFGFYNFGSLKVAATSAAALTPTSRTNTLMAGLGTSSSGTTDIVSTNGYIWTLIISGVIFCTMHVQDLKDVSGDQARGRRSAPIGLGRRVTSWTIAIPVVLWSALCVWFWEASLPVASAPILLGLSVAWRCVNMSGKPADRRTWQLWCAWTAILYIIPPLSG